MSVRCIRCEREDGSGWHHHAGPHACDFGNHDVCSWRASQLQSSDDR